MENRQPSQSNISNESEPQAADSTEETPPVAGPEPSRSQAPDQTIKELKTDEAKYPQLEGFKKEDALAQENLAKMKILYDKLIEHLEGEKDKKGERLFPSELVKQLIQKIQYEPALYKGDENDPISCVNYESGNGTIFISPKFFEKTDEGQLYNFAHELSHLIIHKGIIWTDDYNQYFSAYLEAVTKPESAKKN